MMIAARDSILFNGGVEYWGLCLKAVEPNGSTISISKNGSPPTVSLQYSLNATTWETFTVGSTVLNLAYGKRVWFKATTTNSRLASSSSAYHKFVFSGNVAASGDITSLLNGTTPLTSLATGNNYAFASLFRESKLVEAPDLTLATINSHQIYTSIFQGCTSLTKVAKFPARINIGNGYQLGASLYNGCTNLTDVDMSSTTITTTSTTGIGAQIFRNCTSLRKVKPPIVDLIPGHLLNGCTNLEVVDFRHVTSVVGLYNINAFSSTNDTYKIVVPDSLYSSWITTTNWSDSSIVGHIIKASDYVEA